MRGARRLRANERPGMSGQWPAMEGLGGGGGSPVGHHAPGQPAPSVANTSTGHNSTVHDQLQRLDTWKDQLQEYMRLGVAGEAVLPADPTRRDAFLAAYDYLVGQLKGFVHLLANLDFGEERMLLAGHGAGGAGASQGHERSTVLDRCLAHMQSEIGRIQARLQPVGNPTLNAAAAELARLAEPRPPRLQDIVGAERLKIDVSLAHRAIARLNDTHAELSARVIGALKYEHLVAELKKEMQSSGMAAGGGGGGGGVETVSALRDTRDLI
eukprot:SAG22_NODE_2560_length_2441_cov_2.970965_2_plen_269_part_00